MTFFVLDFNRGITRLDQDVFEVMSKRNVQLWLNDGMLITFIINIMS